MIEQENASSFLELVGKDEGAADVGVWKPFPILGPNVELKIVRAGTPAFERMQDAVAAPYDRKRKPVPRHVAREAQPRIYAATVWVDTRGLPEGIAAPDKVQREAALRANTPKARQLFDQIVTIATELDDEIVADSEVALKNSSTSSAGA